MFALDAHHEAGRARSLAHRRLAIISDLHVSNGTLDDFDPELESHLIGFLDWLGNHPEPTELIINGDFLDFVQASPWSGRDLEGTTGEQIPLCFDERQSFEKFVSINNAHAGIFEALKTFLCRNHDNRLIILPGNHDPDFFWPLVRKEFAKAVCPDFRKTQLSFHLQGAYQPYPWLWIEHGHQYDPVNSFFVGGEERWSIERPPVFASTNGTKRLYECTGTRFLIRYLNGLDARYSFVDNVKPFSRFVKIFGTSALIPGRGPLDAAIAISQILAFLTKTTVGRPQDLLGVKDESGAILPHPFVAWVEQASDTERKKLSATLRERGFSLNVPLDLALERREDAVRLIKFLTDHLDLISGLGESPSALLGDNGGTLTLSKGFNANESEDLYDGAARIVGRERVTTVVMGHTHEAMEREKGFAYFNTGSWTRYYRFQKEESTQSWSILKEKSYEHFPYRLRYVLVPAGSSSAIAETWQERSKT